VIRIRLSSAASEDVREAQAWYAGQATGLDLEFRRELDRVLERIRTYPAGFPQIHRSIRRANLRRFPYGVFYVRRDDHLFVLAVAHHARSPSHWKRRL